jgi:hypothetical protein
MVVFLLVLVDSVQYASDDEMNTSGTEKLPRQLMLDLRRSEVGKWSPELAADGLHHQGQNAGPAATSVPGQLG